MKDKIIQIVDTLYDNEGQTLGLSESGKLYQYTSDLVKHEETFEGAIGHRSNWYSEKNKRWELLLDSPESRERDK